MTAQGIADKKLKAKLTKTEAAYNDAALSAARTEILLTEESGWVLQPKLFWKEKIIMFFPGTWKQKEWKERTSLSSKK